MARGRIYGLVAPVLHAASELLGLPERARAQPVVVRRVTVPAGLGLRIVLAADLHADRRSMPGARIGTIVDLIEGIDGVDLVAMPGDFVGHDVELAHDVARELSRLSAPVVATLGNHDHMEGPALVTAALREAGVRVLVDAAFEFRAGLWIAGLDSCFARVPDRGCVEALLPPAVRCIVLGHEPWLATRHEQVLHLAGHTHHGQVRLPGIPLRYLPRWSRPYPEGLARIEARDEVGERYIYTTAGLGSTTIPLRIGAPPEVVILDV